MRCVGLELIVIFAFAKVVDGRTLFGENDGAIRLSGLFSSRQSASNWRTVADCKQLQPDACVAYNSKSFCLGGALSSDHDAKRSRIGAIDNVNAYSRLEGLPKCWPLLRTVLCAVAVAPCQNGSVRLIPSWQCLTVRKECQFLVDNNLWPSHLDNCTDPSLFSSSCNIYYEFPKWNDANPRPVKCVSPLLFSNNSEGWVIPYCSLNCSTPWLTSDEHLRYRQFIHLRMPIGFAFITLLLICAQTGVLKAPDFLVPLKWSLFCRSIILLCWMSTMNPKLWRKLSCEDDGTLRIRQGSILGEFSPCAIQFIVVHASRIAELSCLALFFYYLRLFSASSDGEHLKVFKRTLRFRRAIVFAPSIFLSIIIACFFNIVDSDGFSGICSVGFQRPVLLILPSCIPVLLWIVFYVLTLKRRMVKGGSRYGGQFSTSRLSAFFVFHVSVHAFTVACQIYEILKHESRRQSLMDFIICQFKGESHCKLANMYNVQLLECVALVEFIIPLFDGFIFMLTSKCNVSSSTFGRILKKKRMGDNGYNSSNALTLSQLDKEDSVFSDVNGHLLANDSLTNVNADDEAVKASCRTHRSSQEFYKRFRNRGDLRQLRSHHSLKNVSNLSLFTGSCSLPSNLRLSSLPSLKFSDFGSQIVNQGNAAAQWMPAFPPYPYPYCSAANGQNASSNPGASMFNGAAPVAYGPNNAFMQMHFAYLNWIQAIAFAQQQGVKSDQVQPGGSSGAAKPSTTTNRSSSPTCTTEETWDSDESDSEEEAFVERQLMAYRSEKNTIPCTNGPV